MDFAEYDRLEEESSLLHWWPRTKDSGVPVPRTVVVEVEHDTLLGILDGAPLPAAVGRVIKEAGKLLGYPLFLRTDQASAKHDWQNGSFVSNEESLFQHIVNVVEFNVMASIIGLPMKAIVLREFLELDTRFTAFHGNMPVAAERRYYVRDGRVECHHPYWIEDAVAESRSLPANWRDMLAELNSESPEEVRLLTGYAETLAANLPGYFSVDFARLRDGRWVFIDAARGEISWHPQCEFSPHLSSELIEGLD